VRGGESEDGVHDERVRSSNAQESMTVSHYCPRQEFTVEHLLGHHICPQGHFGGSIPEHLVGDGGEMVDQAQVCLRIRSPFRLRVDAKLRERELSSLPP
jgi:hypothetical protein